MRHELRHAARRLLRSPAFTLTSVLTLALAIGATAAIFSIVERIVLNPLPYRASDRLVEVDHGAATINLPFGMGITLGLYHHYAERARTLDGIAAYRSEDMTLTGDGEPERIRVARTTTSLAPVLGVAPALGRWFLESEAIPGAERVAVMSHRLWLRRYSGSPAVIGRSLEIAGFPATVVGVMPASYAFPDTRVELWIPEQATKATGFGLWDFKGVARLKSGTTVEAARAELNGLIADLPAAFPDDPIVLGNTETRLSASVRTLKEATIGGVARALWILLASVGLVLAIACANVANLFLVRSDARQREVAVRRALGAGRTGIARYFLSESLLLSLAGGAIGTLVAAAAVRLLVSLGPPTLPRLHEVRLDWVVLVFTAAVSLLSAAAFGIVPLLHGQLPAPLNEAGRGNTASRTRHRSRHVLMGGQIALALVLLVASGLMVRSFLRLRTVDSGFEAASALTFSIGLSDRDYTSRDAAVAAHRAILDRLSELPGVAAVSASTCLPLSGGCSGNTIRIEGRATTPGTSPPFSLFRAIAGGYFETMGIRLQRGRTIDRGDVDRREPVAVVNQAFADKIFPNQEAVGQRVASNLPPQRPGEPAELNWLSVVGVVANTPIRALGERDPLPQMYLPMSLARGPGTPRFEVIGPEVTTMSYVVRTEGAPLGLMQSVRRAIDAVDADLALAQVRPLQNMLDQASAQMAFTMALLATAAAVALMLGIIGIYGVTSYIVSQRTGEIGVRLALGAEPGSVAGLILRQGAVVALAGIVAGCAAAWAAGRLIASLLHEVSPSDPAVFTLATTALFGVALLACWLPARRAARLNPIEALRAD